MDDKLANNLIDLYEKGLSDNGFAIIDVKYGARTTKLIVNADDGQHEYSASVGGGTVLDSHVAVLRRAYWEHVGPLKQNKKHGTMKKTKRSKLKE